MTVTIFTEYDEDGTPYICFGSHSRCPITQAEAEDLIQALSEMLDDPMTSWYDE